VTFLHYAEHIVDIPGKRIARFKVPVDLNGGTVWQDMEEFDTSDGGAHPNWPDRLFARLVDAFLDSTNNRGGRVGDAEGYLISARGLLELALARMKSIATAVSPDAV
jgi:aminoglycoside 3-N-acetyltransferase